MKKNHKFFSNLAFNLANNHLGRTNFNPSVGCLVVKDDAVISSGVTSINGRPHAEFNALNKNVNFKDTYMYTTLEPCTHYGQTPPCTNIIKKKNVKKVFFSFYDPDKRTYKKAKRILKKKIIKFNNIKKKNLDFYKSYIINKKKKFPFIDAKLAVSKDFYTINKTSKWITNYRSRLVTHLIRSKYDCIISTSKSINKDNSLLNCRIDGFDKFKPDLIIIDRNLKLKKKLRLFNLIKRRKIYIFTTSRDKKKINFFKKKKINIVKINSLKNKSDFVNLFKKIYQINKGRVLIESGLIFLDKLFKFKLINNLYLFKSNENLKDKGYNNISIKFIREMKLNKSVNVNLNDNELFKIKIM